MVFVAFSFLYCCAPSIQRPFSCSRVQWNRAEMRGINYISVSNKWFISSASEVSLLLLHLGETWKHVQVHMTRILKKKKKISCNTFLLTYWISASDTPSWGLSSQVAQLPGSSFQLYFSHLLLLKTQHKPHFKLFSKLMVTPRLKNKTLMCFLCYFSSKMKNSGPSKLSISATAFSK